MHFQGTLSFLVLLYSSVLAFKGSSPLLRSLDKTRPFATNSDGITRPVEVAFLLPSSPENPLLQDSAEQIVSKLPCLACAVVCNTPPADAACRSAKLVIALGVESPFDVRFVATAFRLRRSSKGLLSQFALGGKPFAPLLDAYDEANPSWQKNLAWSAAARDRELMLKMQRLFERGEIEDYVQAIQLYLDAKGKN